jgi:Domain of unknown function (DUF4157)
MRDFDQHRELGPAKVKTPAPKPDDQRGDARDTGGATASGIGDAAAALLRLQRSVGNAGVVQMLGEDETAATSPIHEIVGKGGGAPLEAGTRSAMERRFGQDFGDVKVHTDERASASAASVGANAYTVGNEIVFRAGHYDTSSPTGQRTIAHELTHVVQQRSGPVDGSEAPGGIRLSDPGDRFERAADQTASTVVDATAQTSLAETTQGGPHTVQRDGEEEEEMPL